MSNTNDFTCFIQAISAKDRQPIPNTAISFLGNTYTTDENGLAGFPCSLANNEIAKSFPVIIENEQFYALYTNCNAKSHHNKDNPFKLTIYTNNARIQGIGIYTKSGESFNNLYTTDIADKEIFLKAHIVGKMPKKDISWKYYIKDRNEPQWSNVTQIKLLEFPNITNIESHNIQVSFNLKDIKNLKDDQQLFIFAFFNNSAYYATYTNTITKNNKSAQEKIKRKTHAVLEISLLPTLEIRTNTIQFLHNNTNKEYNLTKSCDIDYLLNSLKDSKSCVIKCEKSTIHIKDKHTNADKAIITDSEFEAHKQKQILLDSNSLWDLRHILDSYNQQANKEISVYVKKTISWDKLKEYYLKMHTIDLNAERQSSIDRIEKRGKGTLKKWIDNSPMRFEYNEEHFIKAEIRYNKIGKYIHDAFMQNPYNYINTCATRVSKSLNDLSDESKNNKIRIDNLIGMDKNVYLANADGKSKIIIRVGDMIEFLIANDSFGESIEFEPNNQTDKEFAECMATKFDRNGIVAMKIEGWGDANGHITLLDKQKWEKNINITQREFLDDTNYLNGNYKVKKVYYWRFE